MLGTVRVAKDNLAELHTELINKDYGFAKPEIDETLSGRKEVSVNDPFGNRLTFLTTD